MVNAALVVGAVLVAFPLLWMVSVSFMPTGAASTYPPPLLPAHPTLDNYRELFAKHARVATCSTARWWRRSRR
jgi:multiple sugar transport system permease protein